MSAWSPRILSVLRIVAALLFMEHGLMKLFHFPIAQPGVADPLPMLLVVAAVLDLAFAGAGAWSMDAVIPKGSANRA